MDILTSKFTFDNYPCCFNTSRYYDEMLYSCTLEGVTTTLNFPNGQPGLLLLKYGFSIAEQYEENSWREINYQYFNQFRVSLFINNNALEGYAAKTFPISGYLQSNDPQTCTILDPSKLCDISHLLHGRGDIPISVVLTNIGLPPNACILARIQGRWVS